MQDQPAVQARPAARTALRDELLGPPRLTRRAQFSVVAFGMILVATLVIPVFTDAPAMPGLSLVSLGMMLLMGFAELMDASMRRFTIAVRCGGLAVAALGVVSQLA